MVLSAILAPLSALAVPAGAAAALPPSPSFADGHGLHVDHVARIDARQVYVEVSTPALRGPAEVRILFPADYGQHPGWRYPVLYLMHGAFGGPGDWLTQGDAEATTAGLPMIVVMPAIALGNNGGGSCADWVNAGAAGPQNWETFHIAQLIPWIDQNLPTIANRSGRAIAGLSEGGLCATTYAARHPDVFATALSFSGTADIAYDRQNQAVAAALVNMAATTNGGTSNSVYGDPATDEINWENHDPASLATNLRATNVLMYTGDGLAGPYDPPLAADAIESDVAYDDLLFHNRLDSLNIPNYMDNYGPGTHRWPYWARDLRWSIGTIMADFEHPPPTPPLFTYTIADENYSVYGWQVSMHRTAREFSTLKDADAAGFTLMGSGSGTVITPPVYTPNRGYRIVLHGDKTNETLTANGGGDGRLQLEVPLGPANPYQEDSENGTVAGTHVYSTTVEIVPVPGPASSSVTPSSKPKTCTNPPYVVLPQRVAKGATIVVLINGRRVHAWRTSRGVRVSLAGVPHATYRLLLTVRVGKHTHRTTYVLSNCRLRVRRR